MSRMTEDVATRLPLRAYRQRMVRYLRFFRASAGNLGQRTSQRGPWPGRDNWNVSVFKNFIFNQERSTLQFRAEFFNVWNHPQ
jgi:hypothetical protein